MFNNRLIGVPHPQGYGVLRRIDNCPVRFEYIVPEDLEACPYVLFYSKGIHNHQAPPPIKTPREILGGLLRVIRRLCSLVMTACEFQLSNKRSLTN